MKGQKKILNEKEMKIFLIFYLFFPFLFFSKKIFKEKEKNLFLYNNPTISPSFAPSFFTSFSLTFHSNFHLLCHSISSNNFNLLFSLLQNKFLSLNINQFYCKDSFSPLMLATSLNNQPMIQILLEYNSNPLLLSSFTSKGPITSFHLTTNKEILTLFIQTKYYKEFFLSKKNNNMNNDDEEEERRKIYNQKKKLSLILFISYYKNKNILQLLFEKKKIKIERKSQIIGEEEEVDVNEKSLSLLTPLMLSAQKSNYENMKLLINYHANVNSQDSKGWTALMYSIQAVRTSLSLFYSLLNLSIPFQSSLCSPSFFSHLTSFLCFRIVFYALIFYFLQKQQSQFNQTLERQFEQFQTPLP